MIWIIGGITLFELGLVTSELTDVSTYVILAGCLIVQVGLIAYSKRGKK